MPVLAIAAAIIERGDGMLLFVRKRGTTAFLQPGGKLEPGETADAALARELDEELGIRVPAIALGFVGRFTADAANEADTTVDAWVYDAPLRDGWAIAAEIEQAVWVDPAHPEVPDGFTIAPLSREVLIPLVLARRA